MKYFGSGWIEVLMLILLISLPIEGAQDKKNMESLTQKYLDAYHNFLKARINNEKEEDIAEKLKKYNDAYWNYIKALRDENWDRNDLTNSNEHQIPVMEVKSKDYIASQAVKEIPLKSEASGSITVVSQSGTEIISLSSMQDSTTKLVPGRAIDASHTVTIATCAETAAFSIDADLTNSASSTPQELRNTVVAEQIASQSPVLLSASGSESVNPASGEIKQINQASEPVTDF